MYRSTVINKIFQIFAQGQLLGYTYNETAAKTFEAIAIAYNFNVNIITLKDDRLPLKQGMVKTPEHTGKLSPVLQRPRLSLCCLEVHSVQSQDVPKFSYSFMKQFDEVYEDTLIREINGALDNLLHS